MERLTSHTFQFHNGQDLYRTHCSESITATKKSIIVIFLIVLLTASWRLSASLWGCCCSSPAAAMPYVSDLCLCLSVLVWRLLTDMFVLTSSIYLPHSSSSAVQHGTRQLLLQLLHTQATIKACIQHNQDPQLLSKSGVRVSLGFILLLLLYCNG